MEQLTLTSKASVTVAGKRKGNVKVAFNSNQVKSLQAGVHADGEGLYLVARESGDRVWASSHRKESGKRSSSSPNQASRPPGRLFISTLQISPQPLFVEPRAKCPVVCASVFLAQSKVSRRSTTITSTMACRHRPVCADGWGCPHHGVGEGRGTPAVQILCVNARQGPASGPVHW